MTDWRTAEQFDFGIGDRPLFPLSLNRPYAGTMIPQKFYHRDRSILSGMIEVDRGSYPAGDTEKKASFLKVKQELHTVIQTIKNMTP